MMAYSESCSSQDKHIQNEYINKGIGYYYNIYVNKLWTTDAQSLVDPSQNFSLWSTPTHIGIETFIYVYKY